MRYATHRGWKPIKYHKIVLLHNKGFEYSQYPSNQPTRFITPWLIILAINCAMCLLICNQQNWWSKWLTVLTRQMMIIAGSEPELCQCRRHAIMQEGGVYGRLYALYVLSRMQCAHVVLMTCRKVWKRACVKWPARKTDIRETQGCLATPT